MKLLLCLAGLLISAFTFAQNNRVFRADISLLRPDSNGKGSVEELILSHPAPGIYRLPIDRMPCVVPATDALAAMPNAWKGEVVPRYQPGTHSIPNPGLVPRGTPFTPRQQHFNVMPQHPLYKK